MAERLFLPGPEDIFKRSEGLVLTPEDYVGRQEVTGITLDNWGDQSYSGHEHGFDAEQGINVKRVGKNARVQVHISDPTAFLEKNPELKSYALKEMRSEYDHKGEIERSMLPEAIMRKLALRPGEERPTLTIQVDVNLHTGELSNERIFRSRFMSKKAVGYDEVDGDLKKAEGSRTQTEYDVYFQTAVAVTKKFRGEKQAHNDIQELRDVDKKGEQGRAHYINTQLMTLANVVLNKDCAERAIPTLYWNSVKDKAAVRVWPQSRLPQKPSSAEASKFSGMRVHQFISAPAPDTDWVGEGKPFAHGSNWGNRSMGLEIYGRGTSPIRELRSLAPVVNKSKKLVGEDPLFSSQDLAQVAQMVTVDYEAHIEKRRMDRQKHMLLDAAKKRIDEDYRELKPKEVAAALVHKDALKPDQREKLNRFIARHDERNPDNKGFFTMVVSTVAELAGLEVDYSSSRSMGENKKNTYIAEIVIDKKGRNPRKVQCQAEKQSVADTQAYYRMVRELLNGQFVV